MPVEVVWMMREHWPAWRQFVLGNDRGCIFQTPEMIEVYRRHGTLQPVTLVALEKARGMICGGLVGIISVEKPGLLSTLSTRAIIEGGPLFRSDKAGREAVPMLMQAYDEYTKDKALFSEVWNLFDTCDDKELWTGIGYEWRDHLNFLIDLDRPVEDIWASFSSSRRKNLRRSERSGVTVFEITGAEELGVFYELLQETYNRVKVPLVSKMFFDTAFEVLVPKQMAHFFLARHEGEVIGARAVLTYKDLVYDWYAGARSEARKLCPDETLVWHILQWAVEKGYKWFNFGGAGKPDEEYGPREFKRRFGGRLVNFGRFRKVYSPVKMRIAETGFALYKRVQLPTWLGRHGA